MPKMWLDQFGLGKPKASSRDARPCPQRAGYVHMRQFHCLIEHYRFRGFADAKRLTPPL
jgi:hypothetical protein